jgi:hypothetical protein
MLFNACIIKAKSLASFLSKKLYEKIINLRIIKKMADLRKIRQGLPKTRQLRGVCLKSAAYP